MWRLLVSLAAINSIDCGSSPAYNPVFEFDVPVAHSQAYYHGAYGGSYGGYSPYRNYGYGSPYKSYGYGYGPYRTYAYGSTPYKSYGYSSPYKYQTSVAYQPQAVSHTFSQTQTHPVAHAKPVSY